MKNLVIFYFTLFFVYSCNNENKSENVPKNGKANYFHIPDSVQVELTDNHKRLFGTRIFIKPMGGFNFSPEMSRLYLDDSNYIHIMEIDGKNFFEIKKELLVKLENTPQVGTNLYYKKEFVFGQAHAFLMYAPDKRAGLDEITILFGTEKYIVMGSGIFPSRGGRGDRIMNMMLSMCMNDSIVDSSNQDILFTIDLENSSFKLCKDMGQFLYYTEGGEGDIAISDTVIRNSFLISTMPAMNSYQKQKDYALGILKRIRNEGKLISKMDEETIYIGNMKVCQYTCTGTENGKKILLQLLVFGNYKMSIAFLATLIVDSEMNNNIQEINRIVKSIELKE